MISEATVVAVAAALYLADCVVLLERGQAVLEVHWSSIWLGFGSKHYQIAGKSVVLLNPFTPFFPVFKSLPLFAVPENTSIKVSKALAATSPLAILAIAQFILVFVALPVCLYRAPGWPFFISLLLAYLNALAMLILVWWRFGTAGIARRPLVALGFAWLVCLPLSVNCLRAAGLSFRLGADPKRAMRHLTQNQQRRAREDLAAQIAEAMQETDESDDLHRRLAELKRQLSPEASSGRP